MKVTLPDYKQAGVLVVGDVMLDRYWHGPASRIHQKHRCRWLKSIWLKSVLVVLLT